MEHLSPLTAQEIEDIGAKRPPRSYPPRRLIIPQHRWDKMVQQFVADGQRIDIPDHSDYYADCPNRYDPEEGAYVDPIATVDNPMSEEQELKWWEAGFMTDTARRPINPRAPELITTVGMFTGPGRYYTYGPNPVGNLALRRERNGIVEYAVVLVDRGKPEWGVPGGFARRGKLWRETPRHAGFRETKEEVSVDLSTEAKRRALGGFILTDKLARQKCAPKDTAHAWMVQWFTQAICIGNPGLEGVVLDPGNDPRIAEATWMRKEIIYSTENFMSPHKRAIQFFEGDVPYQYH